MNRAAPVRYVPGLFYCDNPNGRYRDGRYLYI